MTLNDQVRAELVEERMDYGQGMGECKFGFKIAERVWWVGIEGTGHDNAMSGQDRKLNAEIIKRFNEGKGDPQ